MQGQQTQEEYSLFSTCCLSPCWYLCGSAESRSARRILRVQKSSESVPRHWRSRRGPGLTWWSSKTLPANAGDKQGLTPGLRRSYMPQSNHARASRLLSRRAAITEARTPRTCTPKWEKPPQQEAAQLEGSPSSLQVERAHAQRQRVTPAIKTERKDRRGPASRVQILALTTHIVHLYLYMQDMVRLCTWNWGW